MPETSRRPRIALGSDHAGFHIKEIIREFLENSGYPVNDLGTWSEESVDYPDYGIRRRSEGRLRNRGVRHGHGNINRGEQSAEDSGRSGARCKHGAASART